jgi:mono/diheme cytochrome c family protein
MTRQQLWIGFMATVLLLVSLIMLILREPVLQTRAADSQLAGAIDEATTIYLENCAVCHGAAGEGLGVYPALDAVAAMDETTLYRTIERGRYDTQMAAYGIDEGGILSAAQIDDLVVLLQHDNWQTVYDTAAARDLIPPELVVVEVPEETLTQVSLLAGGDALAAGLTLYAENCASCHGANLEGSTLAPALDTLELRTTESYELARLIGEGVPGTLMAGWNNALSAEEMDTVVGLLLRWPEVQAAGVSMPVVEAEPIDMSPEALARGEALFGITCASCHGVSGYGSPMAPALNNALFLENTSDAAMRQIIAMGVSGTVMPAWGGRLSEAQINDLIAYLRSQAPDAPIITTPR